MCNPECLNDSSLIEQWLNNIKEKVAVNQVEKDELLNKLVEECQCYLLVLSIIIKKVKAVFGDCDYECKGLVLVDPSNIKSLNELDNSLGDVKRFDRVLLLRNKKSGDEIIVGVECKTITNPRLESVSILFKRVDGLPSQFRDFISSKLLKRASEKILKRDYCNLRRVGIAYIKIKSREGQGLSIEKLKKIVKKCQKGYKNTLPRDVSILSIVYDNSLYIIYEDSIYRLSLKSNLLTVNN